MNETSRKRKIESYVPFPSFADWVAAGFDEIGFAQFEETLERAKGAVTPEAVKHAIEVATRWAAVDTGAIEGLYEVDRGFTFSVAVEVAVLETIRLEKGVEVARAVEDALTTYEGVLDAATRATPVNETWIRSLHAAICKSQDSYTVITKQGPQERALPKGEYKTEPNNPLHLATDTLHSYAPPLETPREMSRLVDQIRSDEFQQSHPVLQASYAHYAFVAVHPFADGNGRVARALASVFLYRRPGVPLVVFADQKPGYLDALEAADAGRFDSFVRYIGDRTIDTMLLIRDAFGAAEHADLERRMSDINAMLTGRGGLEHSELDSLGSRLINEWSAALGEEIPPEKSAPIRIGRQAGQPASTAPTTSLRAVAGAPTVRLNASSSGTGASEVLRVYSIFVSRPDVPGADFAIMRGKRVLTEAFIRDVSPVVAQALQFRLRNLARSELAGILEDLEKAVDTKLRAQGYR